MELLFKGLLNLKRSSKIAILLLIDILISLVSIWITFNLISVKIIKFFEIDIEIYLILSLTFVLIQILFKSYLKLSRYFDLSSVFRLIKSFISFFIVLIFYKIVIYDGALIPFSNLIIYLIIFFLGMLLKNSLLYNFYNYFFDKNNVKKKKVILYGFNEKTLDYIRNSKNYNFSIEGIINENIKFYHTTNNNFRVLENNELNEYIQNNKITDILLTIKSSYKNKIYYYKKFLKFNVRINFLDDVYNNFNLDNRSKIFKPDFDEVIGENSKKYDQNNSIYKDIKDKVILVTGGAGSIGSVLIERLLKYNPQKIIVVDKDEYSIFSLKKRLGKNSKIYYKLIDTTNYEFLNLIFLKFKPDYVFNAAAYKHVNIVEDNLNYSLYNNIKTALNTCELSIKYKVKKCLLISTDKAVNPSNIMGLSKRLCEKIYLVYSKRNKSIFLIVRFGNVVGSKGSVIPYFQSLIEKRLPLPLTNKNATRYLMSISEACELIIKISVFGDNSGIYLLDMGKPINIYDVTYKLIKFNGLSIKNKKNPSGDIIIKYTGLSKGEKLHEKLSYNINLKKTKFEKIMLCDEKIDNKFSLIMIENLIKDLSNFKNLKNLKGKLKKINN